MTIKQVLILSLVTICLFLSGAGYSQACGIYKIRYVGYVKSQMTISSISLPTGFTLHGTGNLDYFRIKPKNNTFRMVINSPLGSIHTYNAKQLLEFYKSKRSHLPVIAGILKKYRIKKVKVKIPWSAIRITQVNTEKKLSTFEINLGEIIID